MDVQNENFQNFVVLIKALTDNQNGGDSLKQAEQVLGNLCEQSPEFFLLASVALLQIPNLDPNCKFMTSILLRQRTSLAYNIMERVGAETLSTFKAQLLQTFQIETERVLLRSYVNLVSTMTVTFLVNQSNWNELFHFFATNWARSPNEMHRMLSAHYFTSIQHPKIFTALLQNNNNVGELFQQYLMDPSMHVRLEALKGMTNFVGNSELFKLFEHLIPNILQIVTELIQRGEEAEAIEAISKIIELISPTISYFSSHFPTLLLTMFNIINHADLEDDTKHIAAELIVTIAEESPALFRSNPSLIRSFIPYLFNLLSDMQPNANWSLGEKYDEEDEGCAIAAGIIDRLSRAIKGKKLIPIIFEFIPPYINSNEWNHRYAVLSAISSFGEGSRTFLSNSLGDILNLVLPRMQDENERVRWAACNCTGQLCTDFTPNIQSDYHDIILPAVIQAIADKNLRVRAHAIAAVVNFCDAVDAGDLMIYANKLLEALSLNLSLENLKGQFNEHSILVLVIENCLIALSSLAESLRSSFVPYFPTFIQQVNALISAFLPQKSIEQMRAHGNSIFPYKIRFLVGCMFDAIASMGVAVGREIFNPHVEIFITQMMTSKAMIQTADDPLIDPINSSFVKLVQILKGDFEKYFPLVLPDLLTAVTLDPKIEYLNLATIENKADYKYVQLDGTVAMGINNTMMNNKIEACRNLSIYIDEMGEKFHPWIETIFPICKEILSYRHSGEVRVTGANIASALFMALYHHYHQSSNRSELPLSLIESPIIAENTPFPSYSESKIAVIFRSLFEWMAAALLIEDDTFHLSSLLYALNEIIIYGREGITNEVLLQLMAIINSSMKVFIDQHQTFISQISDPTFDSEDLESLISEFGS